ncbi:hypothetical protein Zmor_007578 [Zophobas morio]|uniref:Uncharacterized protein n=1 Tax=Zophobas morio TaxID=2755281 RepID=A0AA38MM74_9CUCU|nr:hypothetical protein Zmor_007578 [Zophobas morio]
MKQFLLDVCIRDDNDLSKGPLKFGSGAGGGAGCVVFVSYLFRVLSSTRLICNAGPGRRKNGRGREWVFGGERTNSRSEQEGELFRLEEGRVGDVFMEGKRKDAELEAARNGPKQCG